MTPDWLKLIEARHKSFLGKVKYHETSQAMVIYLDEIFNEAHQDRYKLLSALKLAIEGLEFYANNFEHPLGRSARDTLEKIQKGEG